MEAEMFLEKLYVNKESFHPEDDAFDIIWQMPTQPTQIEKEKLNSLMQDIYNLPETTRNEFDPCSFLLGIEENLIFAVFMTNSPTERDELRHNLKKAGCLSSMGYNKEDWLWLMPVINKIASIDVNIHFGYHDGTAFCRIFDIEVQSRIYENEHCSLAMAVYSTILEYLKENFTLDLNNFL